MRRVSVLLLGAALTAPIAGSPAAALAGNEGPTDTTARLAMVAPGTSQGTTFAGLSDDGSHVFFSTTADLNGEPTTGVSKVYDAIAGRYVRPVAPLDPSGIGLVASSPDGRFLILSTLAQLLPEDDNSLPDEYWYDGSTLKLIEINGMAPQPAKGAGSTPVSAVIAADGSRVIFNSAYPLVAADLDNENDLYDWRPSTGAWSYLTPGGTSPQSLVGWTPGLDRVLVDRSGATNQLWEVTGSGFAQVATGGFKEYSPDGTRLYFFSQQGYDPADLDNDWDGYELGPGGYRLLSDPSAGVTDIVEVSDDGQTWLLMSWDALTSADTDAESDVYLMRAGQNPVLVTGGTTASPTMLIASDDASTLFYRTFANILPEDTDASDDVYRWRDGVGTTLVTPGAGTGTVLRVDPTGTRALLNTGLALAAGDTDGIADLYRFSGTASYALLTPGAGAVTFVRATEDLKRVLFRTSAKLLPADTNIYLDLYVSDLDVTPPTPTITGPATGTATTTSYTVGSVNHEAVWLDCQVDGGAWTRCSGTNQLNGLSIGTHSVAVRGWDAAANQSAPVTKTWEVVAQDGTPPTVTAPARAIVNSAAISSGKVSVALTWSGADSGSGIDRYELQQKTDAGAWTNVSTSLVSPSSTRQLAPQHTYAFRSRSVDKAGNTSGWATGATFTLSSYQQTSAKVTWAGTWSTVTESVYWGGTARRSSTLGSRATFTATARSIAFVARKGPNRGKAEIYVDGTKVATIDLYSASYQNQRVVWVGSWSTSASRAVKVRVLATSGRPRVDVDAFVILN